MKWLTSTALLSEMVDDIAQKNHYDIVRQLQEFNI